MVTTIQVSDEVWRKINQDRQHSETINDVLERMLKIKKEGKNENK